MASDNGQFHSRQLLDLSPPEIRAHLENDDTIQIPLGACEMHGDHMPLGTDMPVHVLRWYDTAWSQ